jgi:Kef-type K+ transport system membrane component KefB/nucleotide-binding universal stress UspA family protein
VNVSPAEYATLIFLVEVALLMVVARGFGEVMQRLRQPAVMGQLLAGMVLGPSVLGAVWPAGYHMVFPNLAAPRHMLEAVSQIGILMLLLLTGMETDLALVNRTRKASLLVSLSGIVIPFACGFGLAQLLPAGLLPDPGRRLATALFLGVALSISSVKIVAAVIRELDALRRTVGQIIIGAAMLDDTVGWIIISMTAGLVTRGTINPTSLGVSVLGTLAFLAFSFTVGRRLVAFVIRWVNDNLVIDAPVITAILALTFAGSVLTDLIGVHNVLGAFVVGILIGQSPILTRHIQDQLRGLITAFFMPVFFAGAGMGTDLTVLRRPDAAAIAVAFILVASLGKLAGGYLGGRLARLSARESTALAVGMNARGSTEVIVATIGLSFGVLSRDLFTMIVVMAIVTTLAMPPTLRWAIARIPLSQEERARLDRERAESGAFLPKVERVLVVVDRSANGQFASRLGGLLVGSRRILTTVLTLMRGAANAPTAGRPPEAVVKGTARDAGRGEAARETAGLPEHSDVAVMTQQVDADAPEAVAQEIKKGYGMIVLGVADPLPAGGGASFHRDIEDIARTFGGPLGIVVANGIHVKEPLEGPLDILVPVSGTDYSRRAAEVAVAIAAAADVPVTALYVSPRPRRAAWARRGRDPRETEILHDVRDLAETAGVRLTASLVGPAAPEDGIAREIRRNRHTLVVLGVKTRPGERLYFGQIATVLQEDARCSLLLISS